MELISRSTQLFARSCIFRAQRRLSRESHLPRPTSYSSLRVENCLQQRSFLAYLLGSGSEIISSIRTNCSLFLWILKENLLVLLKCHVKILKLHDLIFLEVLNFISFRLQCPECAEILVDQTDELLFVHRCFFGFADHSWFIYDLISNWVFHILV